jgi:ABC-2 type transport system ATP-binding protein
MIFKGRKVLDGTLQSIQSQYGTDTLRVRIQGERPDYSKLQGVEKVTDFGEEQELRLKEGSDSQQILQSLASTHRIDRFEVIHPTLHDIFVRIAGSESVAPTQQAAHTKNL